VVLHDEHLERLPPSTSLGGLFRARYHLYKKAPPANLLGVSEGMNSLPDRVKLLTAWLNRLCGVAFSIISDQRRQGCGQALE
jgi:hypothetical protein